LAKCSRVLPELTSISSESASFSRVTTACLAYLNYFPENHPHLSCAVDASSLTLMASSRSSLLPGSESTSSTPRIILSPLNSVSTPPTAPSAPLQDINAPSLQPQSPPNLVQLSDHIDITDHPSLESVKVTSPNGTLFSIPSPPLNAFDGSVKSMFRDLSRSSGPQMAYDVGEDHPSKASWWGDEKHVARPWHNSPKKKKTVPSEQTEALQSTRRVSNIFLYSELMSLLFVDSCRSLLMIVLSSLSA
jgi:abelson tyrosine-protein kinase 1